MQLIEKKLAESGLNLPQIMIPEEDIDLKKWCVIACDQYTSNQEYWKTLYEYVGHEPSTLKLILPEVFLNSPEKNKILKKINKEMHRYEKHKILKPLKEGWIYVRRTTAHKNIRNGLVLSIDLEKYSFTRSDSLVRPTEKTILDRIPPRLEIRENASLEIPHIMLLMDDPNKTIIEPLEMCRNNLHKLYETPLMSNGGFIEGYHIYSAQQIANLTQLFAHLHDPVPFSLKYGKDKPPLLFAVGDGNHSLVCAKQHWDNVKVTLDKNMQDNHPARFALVEVANIHDKGLLFHPIHRIIKKMKITYVMKKLNEYFDNIEYIEVEDMEQIEEAINKEIKESDVHTFGLITQCTNHIVKIHNPNHTLCAGSVQAFIDQQVASESMDVDYIHDIDELTALLGTKHVGMVMPSIDKTNFFKTIIDEGSMPVKTFSIGHADEKRFYLEAKKIRS